MANAAAGTDVNAVFTDVPAAGPEAVPDPHWLALRGPHLLPASYMPPPMGTTRRRRPWMRAVAGALIWVFLAATAAGVCLTYGPPHLWP